MGDADAVAADAEEALRLAAVHPDQARRCARAAEEAARARGDKISLSVAKRALGVAAMQQRDLDAAVAHLREAVTVARRAGAGTLAAEARTSLASALVLRGATRSALRQITTALRELKGVPAAHARVQQAAILQELGRLDESLAVVRTVLPVLRRAGDHQWAVRALNNRGLLHIERRSFAAAEEDLLLAIALCTEHDLELPRAYAEQNLGCLHAGQGDVPAALVLFDQAEQRYRRLHVQVESLLVDRARLLLSVRLVGEARETAEAAVAAYVEHKRINLPEARLLLSTIALVDGDLETAEQAAQQAIREFQSRDRRQLLALARHARLQVQVVRDRDSVTPGLARRTADELAAAGWQVPALEARVMAGMLALRRGQRAEAREDLIRASRARSAGPAEVRARAWSAEAFLRRADGRRSGALRAVDAGLRIVEEQQAMLGATELRAHMTAHRDELALIGVGMALESGRPRDVFRWAERRRGITAELRPVRPPRDPVLAALLADLRVTMTAMESDGPSPALVQRQVAVEREIRDHCRRQDGCGQGVYRRRIAAVDDVAAELGEAVLIAYVELDEELHAVTVRDGRARLHHLGPMTEIVRALKHLPFALHRLAGEVTTPAGIAAARTVLDRAAAVFDRTLLEPLRASGRPLVIVPSDRMRSVPWSILPSCAGRPVTVAPSAGLWRSAVLASGADGSRTAGPVVVVAGPGLRDADREAESVARRYPGPVIRLRGAEADADRVAAAMAGSRLVHVAAHGDLRSDNPLFSALRLADGPFTVYDLEQLDVPPRHVVLAACDAGRGHPVAGAEVLGLTTALLSQGTPTLVAPVIPVPDGETVTLMEAYHSGLAAGCSPAQALAVAQERIRDHGPREFAAAAGFVCLGAGLTPFTI
ncbi:CHAT domain-containing protein [Actinoplanes couchii]|uniref:CHAT domain-containing protein n=1 Tax=Actinoplanes couchii TaxID=403638 RepID=A0ABQ3XEY0_9ACTN|nr:CHAT domain-containing protein [Actinoplanes couchii]MDR6319907.1 tetratricopeptide (TPR) repeat protein [Actinoplanes couchii]GID57044.1 CHAT domain-containing protein [Actinoplanes couchii]